MVDAISSSRRVSARAAGVGNRRRRLRLAEGADDAARPGVRLGVAGGGRRAGEGRARRASTSTGAARSTAQAKGRTPFTSAVSLVRGLDAAIELLLADGLEAAWERSRRLGRACREGVKAMGLELFSPDEDRSAVVTAVRMPDGVDGAAVVRAMRDSSGVTVAGGQGELSGRIVRIGHIGAIGARRRRSPRSARSSSRLSDAGVAVELGCCSRARPRGFRRGRHASDGSQPAARTRT